ncbi:hypothetical protein [Leifsonia shinshuensis]|uniref:hypothetical protein n=1 Tax=Leifsonia shinshuensis TaxID=150026 RepID=UPI0028592430|nr:hypothetical protein [Leifsonia shinshuensis]MDR6973118.1 hypothetical protein [Leifsonia shinshuensis]
MSATTGGKADDTVAVILDHLRQAADAHGIHEREDLGGVFDEQWPEWYARHMAETLHAAGYRLVRTS